MNSRFMVRGERNVTATEIILIIIGVIFLLGSFMIKDQLSGKDLDQISKLSETDLKLIIQKQLKNADADLDTAIEAKMDEALSISVRAMEKTSNEKIMAINEYSDTVLDSMDKTHNEIMFLYSMLNDKHKELTDLAGELSSFAGQMRATEDAALKKLAQTAEKLGEDMKAPIGVDQKEVLAEAVKLQDSDDERNRNDDILFLHSMGKSDVEIAKELGIGLGVVKLVIGLYKEEGSN
jgi:uncharacterized protein YbjQ (UPF0145 family)